MKSRLLVGILILALMVVCSIAGGLGFLLWQQRQAAGSTPLPAPVVLAPPLAGPPLAVISQ